MRVLSITSRTVTLELNNTLPFYAKEEFEIYVNNAYYRNENRNVFTIFDLLPILPIKLGLTKRRKR